MYNIVNVTQFFTLKWLISSYVNFTSIIIKKRIKNKWIICVVVEVTKNEDISRDREGLSEPGVKLSVNGGERLSMKSFHLYCPNGV